MGEGKRPDVLHRFYEFIFRGNFLFFRSLYSSVKAVKAKKQDFHIDARVRARGKRVGGRKIYLRGKCNSLRGRKNYL